VERVNSLLDYIIAFIVVTSFAFLLINWNITRIKNTQLKLQIIDVLQQNQVFKTLLDQRDSAHVEKTEGFLNFVTQSRDWAFEYIEDVQRVINSVLTQTESTVKYHNEFSSFSGEAKIKKTSIEEIRNLYNPVDLLVESPMNFLPTVDYEGAFNKRKIASDKMGTSKSEYIKMALNSHYSSFYSIMQANLLKKKHELKNGFVYDWVLKLRFDNIIKSQIDLSNSDSNSNSYSSADDDSGSCEIVESVGNKGKTSFVCL
jgi:hypothetical protein